MTHKEYDIFISYRRVGGADKARILKTELEARGYKVFLDFDELKDGVFDKRIMDAIDSSPIFMFLLTPNSLERCLNDDDWVRKEIEYAVDNHKHFIPINPDCTFTSLPAGLSTKVMAGLGQHQFSDVMFGQLFKASINELIADRIRPVLAEWGRVAAASTKGALVRIETDLDCRILRFGKEIGMAQSDDIAEIKLPKGKHKLQFVGLESEADSYECLLSVEDLEYEDYIEVKLLEKYNARKAKEKAERQRIEAERKAKEEAKLRAEQERKAKEEAERRRMEAERKVKEEAARKAEQECKAKEETARKAREEAKAEAARKAEQERIEAEKRAKAKAERDTYLLSLPDDEFKRFEENDKYGFKLKSTGEIVIPLKYYNVFSFSEGLAAAGLNFKCGFIDKTGKEVIPFKYDDAGSFSEGLATVVLNGKYGFIDKTGREVIPLRYDYTHNFSEGLALVILGGAKDNYGIRIGGKCGYVDKTGKEVIPLKYDDAEDFSEGLAKVSLNGRWGFIDKTGKEVIPFKYDYAWSFFKGLATVKLNGGDVFYIDKNGNRVEE